MHCPGTGGVQSLPDLLPGRLSFPVTSKASSAGARSEPECPYVQNSTVSIRSWYAQSYTSEYQPVSGMKHTKVE